MQSEILDAVFVNPFREGDFVVAPLKSFFEVRHVFREELAVPHRLTFFCITFFIEGDGYHHIDFNDFRYEGMSLFFTCKGQLHAFDMRDDVNGYVVYFTEAFVNRNLEGFSDKLYYHLFNYGLNSPQLSIPDQEPLQQDFIALFKMMHHEYECGDDDLKEDIIRCLLRTLLYKAERIQARSRNVTAEKADHRVFVQFQRLLETRMFETRNVQDYCNELSVGYRTLNRVCREFTGKTVKQFVDERLVLEIKRLLLDRQISIKEISYKTGFNEPTNLTKFFKAHTGLLPKNFRAEASGHRPLVVLSEGV